MRSTVYTTGQNVKCGTLSMGDAMMGFLACLIGFVRLAIEEGAALIPVVVMGEVDALQNFIDMPRVQVPTPHFERMHVMILGEHHRPCPPKWPRQYTDKYILPT